LQCLFAGCCCCCCCCCIYIIVESNRIESIHPSIHPSIDMNDILPAVVIVVSKSSSSLFGVLLAFFLSDGDGGTTNTDAGTIDRPSPGTKGRTHSIVRTSVLVVVVAAIHSFAGLSQPFIPCVILLVEDDDDVPVVRYFGWLLLLLVGCCCSSIIVVAWTANSNAASSISSSSSSGLDNCQQAGRQNNLTFPFPIGQTVHSFPWRSK
jgi:hypothetical protein